MGIQNLSSDVRGFLHNLFTKASLSFEGTTKNISSGLVEAVVPPSGSLAAAFQRAAFVAYSGTLQDVNESIDDLVRQINTTTSSVLKDQIEDARLQEKLFYNKWVKNNQQLRTDLGSFPSNIF